MALFRTSTLLARSGLLTKLGAVRVLAGTLMGRLTTGLRVAGRAVLWLGRALLMNPIGIAVTAIAGAAYLLIKYWQPVSGFFKRMGSAVVGVFTGMWTRIKDAFDGGIVGVSKLILDWSPLGLFYKAFAGVLGWFGVELPDDFSGFGGKVIDSFTSGITGVFDGAWQSVTGLFESAWQGLGNIASDGIAGISQQIADFSPLALFRRAFTGVMDWFDTELPEDFKAAGRAMMDGLVGGITNMASRVRESIVGVGDSVVGWFRDKLGINSPSRVFMALGSGIPEGAAQGITGSQGLVKKAALGMATATAVTLAPPAFAVPDVPSAFMQSGNGAGSGMVIHFSPTIHVQGAGDVRGQVEVALRDAYAEFRRNMQRYKAEASRRAMGNIGAA